MIKAVTFTRIWNKLSSYIICQWWRIQDKSTANHKRLSLKITNIRFYKLWAKLHIKIIKQTQYYHTAGRGLPTHTLARLTPGIQTVVISAYQPSISPVVSSTWIGKKGIFLCQSEDLTGRRWPLAFPVCQNLDDLNTVLEICYHHPLFFQQTVAAWKFKCLVISLGDKWTRLWTKEFTLKMNYEWWVSSEETNNGDISQWFFVLFFCETIAIQYYAPSLE